jgi:putative N6-adenine-specific DNA methylase
MRIFAACSPGLEPLLAEEMRLRLPGTVFVGLPGGVEFDGEVLDLYRANLLLRTPNRVLVRLGEFPAAGWPELIRKASRLDWQEFVGPSSVLSFRVTCKQSRLYHSGGVEERVLLSASKALGRPVRSVKHDEEAVEDPASPAPQIVVVRFQRDICTISLDSSGSLLHKRGYKTAIAKAPLRETLASALLQASGWDRTSALIDPFCGSGTIPIEAALTARNIPPGIGRPFGFQTWPRFDPSVWDGLLKTVRKSQKESDVQIIGSDRDEGAVASSRANAERAGLSAGAAVFARKTVSEIVPASSGPGWIVTNPPYGKRIAGRDLRDLYARFGAVLKERFRGWRLGVLTAEEHLAREMKTEFDRPYVFSHGGLQIGCYVGRVS